MRREIVNIILGPEGVVYDGFGPLTIERLETLGLIKETNVLHTSGADGEVAYENHLWVKA